MDQENVGDSMADKEEEQASDHKGDMIRESGDGEEETQKHPEMKPPAKQRETGDGREEGRGNDGQDTGAGDAGVVVSGEAGDVQEDAISAMKSPTRSVTDDEHPGIIPAVDDDLHSGSSQTETTGAEKLEYVKNGIVGDRLVEGEEKGKQTTLRNKKASSAEANLGSRDEAAPQPTEQVNRDETVLEVNRRQVKTSQDRPTPRQCRLPVFRSAHAHVQSLQAPRAFRDSEPAKHVSRFPPSLIRLATVTMAPKVKLVSGVQSLYYEEPRRPRKVISWEEATQSRPPLRVDMEGPTPCSYSPRNKPLNETNAPAWTIGTRCSLDKEGGARTSWVKTWFQTPHVWHSKVDFTSDGMWPSPTDYKKSSLLGPRQRTMTEYPAFSMGRKRGFSYAKPGADKEPSPFEYDLRSCDRALYRSMPAYTHQFRRDGTILWSPGENTPGPGAYSPSSCNHRHSPAFSIKGIRREKSHVLGPYSTF